MRGTTHDYVARILEPSRCMAAIRSSLSLSSPQTHPITGATVPMSPCSPRMHVTMRLYHTCMGDCTPRPPIIQPYPPIPYAYEAPITHAPAQEPHPFLVSTARDLLSHPKRNAAPLPTMHMRMRPYQERGGGGNAKYAHEALPSLQRETLLPYQECMCA